MENVMDAKRVLRRPKIIKLSKFDYLFLLGFFPICVNLVSSIYKASQVNWSVVTNEGETAHIESGFLYYFVNTIDDHKILFLLSFILIGFALFRILKDYKNKVLEIRKAKKSLRNS